MAQITVRFEVPGIPVGKGRPRFFRDKKTGTTGAYTPAKTKAFEKVCRMAYAFKCGNVKLEGPLMLLVRAVFATPLKEEWAQARVGKPDLDNIVKAICDALNGLAWKDDSQVWMVHAEKIYGQVSKTVVEISTTPVPEKKHGN